MGGHRQDGARALRQPSAVCQGMIDACPATARPTALTLAPTLPLARCYQQIDCTKPDNQPVCKKNHINAFPTIITYRNHAAHSHEHYHGDRTTEALLQFVKNVYDATAQDVSALFPMVPPSKPTWRA